jgi:hypothetical protein
MGIRFYCPNGHRLHVKSFLAGKRGICPHCATRFRIPLDSEIPRGSPKVKPDSQAAEAAAAANGKRQGAVAAIVATSTEKPQGQVINLSLDPIAEAPDAVWYVRPPSGGQYGPAKGEVMRRWILEGRVSADSLVWREGWSDWTTAGPVFPTLNSGNSTPAASLPKREAVSLQLQPAASDSPSAPRQAAVTARAAPQPKSLATVIILGLIVLALVVVLVMVLSAKG